MSERPILSIDELARQCHAARVKAESIPAAGSFSVRAAMTAVIEPPTDGSRRMIFVLRSGEDTDRNGYRTNPGGWRTENYMRNPVVLWAHDQTSLPVARCTRLWTDGDMLLAEAEFTPEGMLRFNDSVFELLAGGFLNAVSCGWVPIDYEFVELEDGGWEIAFKEQDLIEFSVVPVPADPGALRVAAARGLDVGPVRAWAQKLLGEPRYIITADGVDAGGRAAAAIRKQFEEFYPGARALVVPAGMTITALPGTDAPDIPTMTAGELAAEVAAITAGVEDADTASTDAAASTTEVTSAGLPLDWYRVQLELAKAEQEKS